MQQNSKCKNTDETHACSIFPKMQQIQVGENKDGVHAAFLPICNKIQNVKTNMELM